MEKIGKSLVIAGLLLIPALGWANQTSLDLTVDKTTVSAGESITARVTVHGEMSPPQPVLQNTDAFDTQSLGTSSQISIINGKYSSAKSFEFLLTPRQVGSFTIGPAEVVIDGQTYRSDTVVLTIAPGEAAPPSPQQTGDRAAFATAELSEGMPFVNQQLLYIFRFYSRVPIRGTEFRAPTFNGFRKEQLGDARQFQKILNGQEWSVSEVRWALYPISAGDVQIEGPQVMAELVLPSRRRSLFNDPFFDNMFQQVARKTFSARPITVQVRPLPEAGKPADFSGLVGTAAIGARLSSQNLEVGESATLTLTVKGQGDIRDLPTPRLEGGADFKTYDDQPSFKAGTGGQGLEGTKTFKKAIVPLRAGHLTLSPFQLSYFDPASGQYQSVATDPITINVRPSSHPEAVNPAIAGRAEHDKQGVTLLAHDLMPIEQGPSSLRSQNVGETLQLVLLLIDLVALLGFTGAWLWRRRIERIRSDSGLLRRERAAKSAAQGIRRLSEASDAEFPEHAAQLLRQFIGDKAGIDGGSLTPADVDARLESRQVSAETREAIRKFLSDCDAALYGGESVTAEVRGRLTAELKQLIARTGKEIRA